MTKALPFEELEREKLDDYTRSWKVGLWPAGTTYMPVVIPGGRCHEKVLADCCEDMSLQGGPELKHCLSGLATGWSARVAI